MLEVTETVAVLTQPLAGLVTVAVKTPGLLTVADAVVPPETIPVPDHAKVAPLVEELAFTIPVVDAQVKVDVVEALAFGCTVLVVTDTVA